MPLFKIKMTIKMTIEIYTMCIIMFLASSPIGLIILKFYIQNYYLKILLNMIMIPLILLMNLMFNFGPSGSYGHRDSECVLFLLMLINIPFLFQSASYITPTNFNLIDLLDITNLLLVIMTSWLSSLRLVLYCSKFCKN